MLLALLSPGQLTATIDFPLPDSRLLAGSDPALFALDLSKQRPFEAVELPINDLRPELEREPVPALTQLDERGFAVLRHESSTVGGAVDMADGIAAYLKEVPTSVLRLGKE